MSGGAERDPDLAEWARRRIELIEKLDADIQRWVDYPGKYITVRGVSQPTTPTPEQQSPKPQPSPKPKRKG